VVFCLDLHAGNLFGGVLQDNDSWATFFRLLSRSAFLIIGGTIGGALCAVTLVARGLLALHLVLMTVFLSTIGQLGGVAMEGFMEWVQVVDGDSGVAAGKVAPLVAGCND
jgi:hypothetical protein